MNLFIGPILSLERKTRLEPEAGQPSPRLTGLPSRTVVTHKITGRSAVHICQLYRRGFWIMSYYKRNQPSQKEWLICLRCGRGSNPRLRRKRLFTFLRCPPAAFGVFPPRGDGGRGWWDRHIPKKTSLIADLFCGAEGARTLDLRRDRPAF